VNFDPALGTGVSELVDLISRGELVRSNARARELLERYPEQAELWRLLGICCLQQGQYDLAHDALSKAVELAPHSVEIWCNLASVQTARNALDDAERALHRALKLDPNHPAALNNLGSLLDARGDYLAAAECFAHAIAQRPDYARAWLNQAGALLTLGRIDRAETSVRRAIQLAPEWPDAYFLLGNVLSRSGRIEAAAEAYRDAVHHGPRDARYHYQLALTLEQLRAFAQAQTHYESALLIDPGFWPALSQLAFLKRRLCDWHQLSSLSQQLLRGVDQGATGITPFSLLVEDSTPAQQLACASRFAELKQAQVALVAQRFAPAPQARARGPIRVGFVSSGFGEHPTALLIVELIERLRRSDLHTIGFATTPDDRGPLRARLGRAFREMHDLSAQPLQGMLRLVRDARVDVLLDLDGYCENSHPELFALRAAPLQVNWLAYPGTLGAPWYDYLIADHELIPASQRAAYQEKIAWLPRCYQPTDTTRVVAAAPARAALGLPPEAIVFASFNNSWKFTLRSFARWVKILKAVPGSVLWLLTGPEGSNADDHLRHAAVAAGIDPQRLVFAARVRPGEHLARFRHADLFLDTSPYSAHTTASDALWAGCPVLTAPGATFASRVAASLNHFHGFDELNAASDAVYVETAIGLAQDPSRLHALRERLGEARKSSGLFDMGAYTRDFEALLTAMFKRHEAGYDAEDFEVSRP